MKLKHQYRLNLSFTYLEQRTLLAIDYQLFDESSTLVSEATVQSKIQSLSQIYLLEAIYTLSLNALLGTIIFTCLTRNNAIDILHEAFIIQ